MNAIKPGDKLYHVCEIDPPDQKHHTWEVRTEEIEQVRRDGFLFTRMVRSARLQRHHTIGRLYHRDPSAAVRAFHARQEQAVAAARRAIAEAERAMTWAETAQVSGIRPYRKLDRKLANQSGQQTATNRRKP